MPRNFSTALFLRLCVLFTGAAVVGCGPGTPQVTVHSHTLKVLEQNYGLADMNQRYCNALTGLGQFEIMLTDQPVCSDMKAKPPKDNKVIFHGQEINVLRLIIPGPSNLKVTQANVFTVGKIDCANGNPPDSFNAVAYFSHNPLGASAFDVNLQADSGTITIPGNGYDKSGQMLNGTFDLTYAGERVTGGFDAQLCSGLTYLSTYGQ